MGGPTAARQDTKPLYLYKKEMDDALKANDAERKKMSAAFDSLKKERQALGREISKLESEIEPEKGKRQLSGERLAELRVQLEAKRNELVEKQGMSSDIAKTMTHLEGRHVAITRELANIRKSFKHDKTSPEIGENIFRSHLEETTQVDPNPKWTRFAPVRPNTPSEDAIFGRVVNTEGFALSKPLPPGHEPASSVHSEPVGAHAKSIYHFKQFLKTTQPEVKKKIAAEKQMQEKLLKEAGALDIAISRKEMKFQSAAPQPGTDRSDPALESLRSELENLKGLKKAKYEAIDQSKARMGYWETHGNAVNSDLKAIRKNMAVHVRSPVAFGDSFGSLLQFRSPIAPNPARKEYMGEKGRFKAMSPSERVNHLAVISGRPNPQVGPNPYRDALESQATGQLPRSAEADDRKAKKSAESERFWEELSLEKRQSFSSARILEEKGMRYQARRPVAPKPGSRVIPTFDHMLRVPAKDSITLSMFRDEPPSPSSVPGDGASSKT